MSFKDDHSTPLGKRPASSHQAMYLFSGIVAAASARYCGTMGLAAGRYLPRAPEQGVLHTVVRTHLEEFLQHAAERTEVGGLPRFVEDEFRGFLTCGILDQGFTRLQCEGCGLDRLLPFSCKGRGVCPSCGGRRMNERAAHAVEEALPAVPVRQWVLSLPHRVRYVLAWDHGLCRAVLAVYVRARILRLLARRGLSPDADVGPPDAAMEESPALASFSAASVQGRVALGSRAGARVMAFGRDPEAQWVTSGGPRHAHLDGFDLHENVAVPGADRERLEQLCRYLLRPAVAQERLRLTADGRIVLELKTAWADGTSHIVFEPLDFLARLASLTPRPRVNLIFYHGVLAPHSGWRAAVVSYGPAAAGEPGPSGEVSTSAVPEASGEDGATRIPRRGWTWAQLMRRAFDVDVLACPACGGRLRLIALIVDPRTIRAILDARGRPSALANRAPPSQRSAVAPGMPA